MAPNEHLNGTAAPAPIPEPIRYAKQEINGILVRPDSRSVILKAIREGRPIDVESGNDYINLYHVYERIAAADPRKYKKTKIVRKQIGPERWLIFLTDDPSKIPDVQLEEGYDPKRGRYKRYALELAEGAAVSLSNKVEAIKARRAWQLYVPSENRRHLRSTIRKVPKTGKFVVMILERAG